MNANQECSSVALRHPQLRALGLGAAFLTIGLLAATQVAAQSSSQQSERQTTSGVNATGEASRLSPATIRMLQHSLIQGGYIVDATDGVYGPKTAAAVREFQQVKGFEPTGLPDDRTLEALGVRPDGAGPAATPRQSASGTARQDAPPVRTRTPSDLESSSIRAIQQALDEQGLQVGPVDGVWGEQTTTAIANLQRAHGMPASGVPDAHTLAILGLLPGGPKAAEAARAGQPLEPARLDPAAIRLIQQGLGARGFEVGAIDGVWGKRTTEALREFQRGQGLEPDGKPDVYTLEALGLLPD